MHISRGLDMSLSIPSQVSDVFINKAVANMTRQTVYAQQGDRRDALYAHVELSFPVDPSGNAFGLGNTMAFSITQSTTVFMRLKSWRDEYEGVPLNLHTETYTALFTECVRLSGMHIRFDYVGMYASSLPGLAPLLRTRTRAKHGSYCSKIIVEVLQQFDIRAGELHTLDPCVCNPNTLYVALLP